MTAAASEARMSQCRVRLRTDDVARVEKQRSCRSVIEIAARMRRRQEELLFAEFTLHRIATVHGGVRVVDSRAPAAKIRCAVFRLRRAMPYAGSIPGSRLLCSP